MARTKQTARKDPINFPTYVQGTQKPPWMNHHKRRRSVSRSASHHETGGGHISGSEQPPPPQPRAPQQRRRYTKAFAEIRHYQKTAELLIPRRPFARVVLKSIIATHVHSSRLPIPPKK
ncbi:hypothetical protein KP509_09G019100 [Ceratopteris richardii]|uniref:Histone H2A/H2B/H3 domain-containing protein n=1 Tax=Ceratopteris richardii TaxID=49495 RepID=A0A8T2TZD7_CERRI|nr:hypothetical protein KP509_09G019100 [Ceratopteris richardii]